MFVKVQDMLQGNRFQFVRQPLLASVWYLNLSLKFDGCVRRVLISLVRLRQNQLEIRQHALEIGF